MNEPVVKKKSQSRTMWLGAIEIGLGVVIGILDQVSAVSTVSLSMFIVYMILSGLLRIGLRMVTTKPVDTRVPIPNVAKPLVTRTWGGTRNPKTKPPWEQ